MTYREVLDEITRRNKAIRRWKKANLKRSAQRRARIKAGKARSLYNKKEN